MFFVKIRPRILLVGKLIEQRETLVLSSEPWKEAKILMKTRDVARGLTLKRCNSPEMLLFL